MPGFGVLSYDTPNIVRTHTRKNAIGHKSDLPWKFPESFLVESAKYRFSSALPSQSSVFSASTSHKLKHLYMGPPSINCQHMYM